MDRRQRLAISIGLAAVLAGCLGGYGTDPAPARPPEATWADGQGLNATVLVEHHFAALRAAGSFSRNHTSTVAIDGDTRPDGPRPEWYRPPRHTHEQVDLADSRLVHVSVTAGHRRSAKFVSPDVDADRRRPCPPGECAWEYDYDRRPEGDTLHQLIDRYRRDRIVEQYGQVFDDWNFTYVGTTTLDGEPVHRYAATWTFDRPVHPFAAPPNGTGTLLVTEDGVIRRWETTFTGEATVTAGGGSRPVDVTRRDVYTFYAVGETEVDRPAWVDRAASRHEPPTTETGAR